MTGVPLGEAMVILGATVVAAPLFKRLGLGAAVGYLAAGVLIGPSVLGVVEDTHAMLGVAELGVVLMLFVIGLELKLTRLFAMRRSIVGFGFAQIAATSLLLAIAGAAFGFEIGAALIVGFAFALSGTAFAVQALEDRGHLTRPYGQRTFAVLLAQDLAAIPVLALIPALAGSGSGALDLGQALSGVGIALGAVAVIVLAGRFLINPVLRLVARAGAREVMVAAALLVVLGAALAAQAVGLSMALGAFLAGLLLSESEYRHELEADVEPFRGLLLAVFFMGVGMTIDVATVAADWPLLAALVACLLAVKFAVAAGVARGICADTVDAARIGALLMPGSEFALVILPLAASTGLIDGRSATLLVALVALSMLAGPLAISGVERWVRSRPAASKAEIEALPVADGAKGSVLVIGFGRFGQMAAQLLLAEGIETTLIDSNPSRVANALRFGFDVYYGDGTRLDVLRAAGADKASVVMVCVGDPERSLQVVDLLRSEFPLAKIHARAFDRVHAMALMEKDVDHQMRETFESALLFGREALIALGFDAERAIEVEADVRRRDLERLELQRAEGLYAGLDILHQKTLRPSPLTEPDRRGEAKSPETAARLDELAQDARDVA